MLRPFGDHVVRREPGIYLGPGSGYTPGPGPTRNPSTRGFQGCPRPDCNHDPGPGIPGSRVQAGSGTSAASKIQASRKENPNPSLESPGGAEPPSVKGLRAAAVQWEGESAKVESRAGSQHSGADSRGGYKCVPRCAARAEH